MEFETKEQAAKPTEVGPESFERKVLLNIPELEFSKSSVLLGKAMPRI